MITVSQILSRAYILLEDEDHDVWEQDELITWINDAVLAVINIRPDVSPKRSVVTLVEGTYQSLPDDGSMLIKVIRDMSTHLSITGMPLDVLDDQLPNWREPVMSKNVEHYIYDDRDPKHFEVYPSVSDGVQIEIEYGAIPAEVSMPEDTITLKREFLNILVDWVLYRAWSKDDESADLNKSTLHFQAFMNNLGVKTESDKSIIPSTLNAVGVRP